MFQHSNTISVFPALVPAPVLLSVNEPLNEHVILPDGEFVLWILTEIVQQCPDTLA